MGLILDLAVLVLATTVIGSLALLAWTLAVSSVRAARDAHRRVTALRGQVAEREAALGSASAGSTLAELASRTRPR